MNLLRVNKIVIPIQVRIKGFNKLNKTFKTLIKIFKMRIKENLNRVLKTIGVRLIKNLSKIVIYNKIQIKHKNLTNLIL